MAEQQEEEFLKGIGEFPLDRLSPRFSEEEQDFIHTVYACFLLNELATCKRQNMNWSQYSPPPCIGTATELWCIFQIFFQLDINTRRSLLNDLRTKTTYFRRGMHPILQDKLTEFNNSLSNTTISILEKISRRFLPEDQQYYPDMDFFNVFVYRSDEDEEKISRRMLSRISHYGDFQFNSRHFDYAFSNLTPQEVYTIQWTYLKIVWAYFLKLSDYLIPQPEGTGMEVYLMIKIVDELKMMTIPLKTTRFMSNLLIDQFMDQVEKPHPFGAMLTEPYPLNNEPKKRISHIYDNIKAKISAQVYEDYSVYMHRNAALLMSRHPRLGSGSALGELPEEIIRKIIKQREKIDLAEVGRAQRHLPLWLQSLPHS